MDDGGVSQLMQMNANYVEATAAIQEVENTNTNLKHTIQMSHHVISENEEHIKNFRADTKQIIKARAAKRKQIMARGGRVFVRNQEELDFIAFEVQNFNFKCLIVIANEHLFNQANAMNLNCERVFSREKCGKELLCLEGFTCLPPFIPLDRSI